jgi:hypothetical protein
LPDGKVFVAGGYSRWAEIYDPATESYSEGPWHYQRREIFGMSTMADGRVLIAGGSSNSAETFDPVTETFGLLSSTTNAGHRAVNLADGKILIAGGYHSEIFDPVTETFIETGGVLEYHLAPRPTLHEDGRVLKTGGCSCPSELYIP